MQGAGTRTGTHFCVPYESQERAKHRSLTKEFEMTNRNRATEDQNKIASSLALLVITETTASLGFPRGEAGCQRPMRASFAWRSGFDRKQAQI